jgi:hypothetical protein
MSFDERFFFQKEENTMRRDGEIRIPQLALSPESFLGKTKP